MIEMMAFGAKPWKNNVFSIERTGVSAAFDEMGETNLVKIMVLQLA